jgi:hypothetical protein
VGLVKKLLLLVGSDPATLPSGVLGTACREAGVVGITVGLVGGLSLPSMKSTTMPVVGIEIDSTLLSNLSVLLIRLHGPKKKDGAQASPL